MFTHPLLLTLVQVIPPDTAEAIERTANNTNAFPYTIGAIIISLVSLVVGIFAMKYARQTLHSQRQTEKNTYRLEPEVQKNLLIEMCRHLYRNMVISYAISEKMRISNYTAYPSEEHLLKMKVTLEDIHDEIFYKNEKEFFQISKLYMYLRNYNAELDIICDHFRNPTIDVNTKQRDVTTLLLKCHFLIKEIFDFIVSVDSVWDKLDETDVRNMITSAIEDDRNKRKNEQSKYKGDYNAYHTLGTVFTDKFYPDRVEEFLAEFNEDVIKEMGVNREGGEKIHMIHFS